MTILPESPAQRIGEEARDAAVRRLQEAYADGHVTHEELDAGLDRVLAARTHGEVASALAGLPAQDPGTATTIGAAAGSIRRRGQWRVPRRLTVESALGKVRLNLSRADFEQDQVDIELRVGTGNATLIVPRDAVVDVGAVRAGWKDTHYRPRTPTRPGGPTIRISGVMGFGRLKIRHARR
ncbi:DUF1707 domain-containing protein [Streptomyces sp. NPDC088745]|uniref:DUF1707 SHOCT-like domain-containing protein n=1 Tax=Streptomyces sp. NPDC088745 TaxID=3365884 RepID=UPI003819A21A